MMSNEENKFDISKPEQFFNYTKLLAITAFVLVNIYIMVHLLMDQHLVLPMLVGGFMLGVCSWMDRKTYSSYIEQKKFESLYPTKVAYCPFCSSELASISSRHCIYCNKNWESKKR